LDLTSVFFQIPIKNKEFASFSAPSGQYQFKRLPMSALPSISIFQSRMLKILQEYSWRDLKAYIDDIILIISTCYDHLKKLEKVFEYLEKQGATLKLKKCDLGVREVK
jgi:hypothetical protein